LSCCLLSRRHLLSICASASHCTAASHPAPPTPLVRLVVASLLILPPPPVRLHLRLSSRQSCASCLAGCCVTSRHATTAFCCLRLRPHCAATSHCAPLAPLFRLVVVSPLITPLHPVHLPSASHCTAAWPMAIMIMWCVTADNYDMMADKDPRKSELLLGYLGLRPVYRITPPHLHML
jgi:hypothetical protein